MNSDEQDKLSSELIELSIDSIRKLSPSLALTLRNALQQTEDADFENILTAQLKESDLVLLIQSIAQQGRERLELMEQWDEQLFNEKHALNAWLRVARQHISSNS